MPKKEIMHYSTFQAETKTYKEILAGNWEHIYRISDPCVTPCVTFQKQQELVTPCGYVENDS